MNTTNVIHYVVKMPVPQENTEAFLSLAKELVAKSQQEPGNIYYHLTVSKKDPTQLTFLECWKDKAAIAYHNETEHFTRILPQLLALCSGAPVKETYLGLEEC